MNAYLVKGIDETQRMMIGKLGFVKVMLCLN